MTQLATERPIPADSQVHLTDEWIKARLRNGLKTYGLR